MRELIKVSFGEHSNEKLSDLGIRVLKDRTLLAPGFWNGRNYSKEEIVKAYQNTDWSDKDVISLIADHNDDDNKGRPLTIRDWVGYVSNQYLTDDGKVKGDLNICVPTLATQLIDGKAPFGISPFVYGQHDKLNNSQVDFIFKNFAVVVEPACKECYINEYLGDDGLNDKLAEITAFERIRKRMGMSPSQFYAVPRDPPSSSSLPIFDAAHVRNAMARFNQTNLSPEEKSKAKSKIISAANKFGIDVKNFEKLEETCTGDISGSEIKSHGLQPVKVKKKKSDLTQMKGGKTKMEEEKKIEEVEESTEEEKVDEVSEPVEEEKKEESVEMSEDEEEESEDKLMEKLAEITEKLMNKRKLTPEQAKMQKLEKELDSLKKEMKKLQEEKEEPKEESNDESKESEKLSAKSRTMARTIPTESGFKVFGKEVSAGSRELASMLGY